MEFFEIFQYDWAIRALIASSLVGVMCGILGCFIVLRNMSLIGDALSHSILPGVVVGFMIAGHSILAFFTGSIIAGLITALLITLIQRKVKGKEDAAIGIVFTVMFALGVIGISWLGRKEGVHLDLKDFLFGNVLGVSNADLILTSIITGYIILCLIVFYRYFFATTFQQTIAQTLGISTSTMHYFLMLLLSFAVVASLQSVGVILVVAMLIIPASTAYLITSSLKKMLLWSSLIGLTSTIGGLSIAILLETTPGPAMTVTAGFIYLIFVLFSPKKGLLVKAIRDREKQRKYSMEDVLKQCFKAEKPVPKSFLEERTGLSSAKVAKSIKNLLAEDLLTLAGSDYKLTQLGSDKAEKLLRAHRLWETYMVKQKGNAPEHTHAQAEKIEHHLSDKLIEDVDSSVGSPTKDPHGSPIPPKRNK
ncbi:MAG: ABC-type Mn2+/Zn2+ transport system permease subunit [Sphingobacteriales bacterium]|jgi:ABC-type Mn2+/Zn2+ transport system permease subunit/Mn-dependent DtxR family transcriptional regulator